MFRSCNGREREEMRVLETFLFNPSILFEFLLAIYSIGSDRAIKSSIRSPPVFAGPAHSQPQARVHHFVIIYSHPWYFVSSHSPLISPSARASCACPILSNSWPCLLRFESCHKPDTTSVLPSMPLQIPVITLLFLIIRQDLYCGMAQ